MKTNNKARELAPELLNSLKSLMTEANVYWKDKPAELLDNFPEAEGWNKAWIEAEELIKRIEA